VTVGYIGKNKSKSKGIPSQAAGSNVVWLVVILGSALAAKKIIASWQGVVLTLVTRSLSIRPVVPGTQGDCSTESLRENMSERQDGVCYTSGWLLLQVQDDNWRLLESILVVWKQTL
jgi:hypothetical protein